MGSSKLTNMKQYILLILSTCLIHAFGQVGISKNTINVDASAILHVESSDQGILYPRLSVVERNAIGAISNGLTIYNTDLKCLEFYNAQTQTWFSPCCQDKITADYLSQIDKYLYVTLADKTSVVDANGFTANQTSFDENDVASWLDRSSNGRNLQATAANYISYTNFAQNSYVIDNYLSIDGSSNNALEHIFPTGQKLSGQDFDVSLLGGFLSTTATPNAMLMASSNSTGNGTWEIGQGSSATTCSNGGGSSQGKYVLRMNNAGTNTGICGSTIDDQEHLFRVSYDSTSSVISFYMDNELLGTSSLTAASFGRVRLFLNRFGSVSSQAKIQSVIIYDRVLSTQDASEQEKYLTCQWGI